MEKQAILLHHSELDVVGVDVKSMERLNEAALVPHRDDHYMFVIQRRGHFLWELDFNKITLSGSSMCFVVPGQVHRYIECNNSEGWFVFVDSGLIAAQFRQVFDTYLNTDQLIAVADDDAFLNLIPALEALLQQEHGPFQKTLIYSLTGTLTGMIASKLIQSQNAINPFAGQKYNTVMRFKLLVNTSFKEMKQVKSYAALLNITPLHLNEVVKEITGFVASHWIHQAILLEAKRLLVYSVLDVKEIAYALGYEDHAYFSRFFKTNTGMTAKAFRTENH